MIYSYRLLDSQDHLRVEGDLRFAQCLGRGGQVRAVWRWFKLLSIELLAVAAVNAMPICPGTTLARLHHVT